MPAGMSGLKELVREGPGIPTEDEAAALLGLTLSAPGLQEFKAEAFNGWTTGATWYAWCSTTNTTMTTGDTAWVAWNNGVTTTAGSMSLNYTTGTAYVSTGSQWVSWNTSYTEMTEEQQAELAEAHRVAEERRLAQQAEWAAAERERQAGREKASARATGLLLSLLSDEQAATYREHGWFEVRGSSGRRWRVRNRGQSGNVDLMPEIGDVREATYCAHPPGSLPDADAHVAQMLALVTDDAAFERTANRHYPRGDAQVPPFMREAA
jgi:hypothetical protein